MYKTLTIGVNSVMVPAIKPELTLAIIEKVVQQNDFIVRALLANPLSAEGVTESRVRGILDEHRQQQLESCHRAVVDS